MLKIRAPSPSVALGSNARTVSRSGARAVDREVFGDRDLTDVANVRELNRAGDREINRVGRRVRIGRQDRFAERDAVSAGGGNQRRDRRDGAVDDVVRVADRDIGQQPPVFQRLETQLPM